MKHILKILVLLFLLITTRVSACNCSIPISLKAIQDYEFENSECIFIGEVLRIDPDKSTFKIKVIESFKGKEVGNVYSGIFDKYCGPIINEKGKWLIYGNFNSENQIKINTCGLTRSFENPENNISATKPPEPLPPNDDELKPMMEKERIEWKLRAKTDLKNEINILRKRMQ